LYHIREKKAIEKPPELKKKFNSGGYQKNGAEITL